MDAHFVVAKKGNKKINHDQWHCPCGHSVQSHEKIDKNQVVTTSNYQNHISSLQLNARQPLQLSQNSFNHTLDSNDYSIHESSMSTTDTCHQMLGMPNVRNSSMLRNNVMNNDIHFRPWAKHL